MTSANPTKTNPKRAELDLAQWRDVFGRLDELLDVPPEDRLRAVEQGMLQGDFAVDAVLKDFCQRTTMTHAAETAGIAAISQALLGSTHLEAGQRCGNYRLIEAIGQGGMGSVWRGERIDGLYQSQVAVKLLGSLALSAHARSRFAREGELLARLTHPHIARLLDAGLTDDHQRFLVLELVVGQDITAYVKSAALDRRATLTLFRQVLAAVAFAHSQLVVHRDIKPSNVMVTTDGQVKLLDFGVAKLIDADEADDNLTRVVGAAYTEAYAAPEQLRGESVGTAADVFSLGCLLHQLLSGESPRWLTSKRELTDGMQPVNSSAAWADLPDDLRAVVRKALAVSPDERYATVAAFDDDLGRFLQGEAVRAQPATRLYRWRKFVLRNRWPVLAGIAASVAVIASLGAALWQLQEARAQRTQAVSEASRANQVTTFLTDLFRASDPRLAASHDKQTLTARQLLDSGTERLKTELTDQPETKIALLGILAEIYGFLDDDKRFNELNAERIRLATERFGPLHPAVIVGRLTDADAELYAGNFDAARATFMEMEAPVRKVFGDGSERYAMWLASTAELERRAKKLPSTTVIARFERSLAIFRNIGSTTEEAAVALQNYSTSLSDDNQIEAALKANSRAIALLRDIKTADQGSLSISYTRRAEMLQVLGRHDEVGAAFDHALELLGKSFGVGNTLYLDAMLWKAKWLHDQGSRAEAWRLVDQVFAAPRQRSANPLGIPLQHYVKGVMLFNEGRNPEAVAELGRAVKGWRDANNNPSRLAKAEAALAAANAALASRGVAPTTATTESSKR
jgi:eukaryotic-like serine/threonine-protein kinase